MARIDRSNGDERSLDNTQPPAPIYPLPDVSSDLIHHLERTFATTVPPLTDAHSIVVHASREAGHREVIEHLKAVKQTIETDNYVHGRRLSTAPGAATGSATAATG